MWISIGRSAARPAKLMPASRLCPNAARFRAQPILQLLQLWQMLYVCAFCRLRPFRKTPARVVTVPLLIVDDLGMLKLPLTAAEELLEIIMRRYERSSTMLTSNRPVENWGKLLGDAAAVSAMLDRLLHHGHVLKCGPRSWRTKTDLPPQEAAG
jgi:hypothetical protein